MNDLDEYLHENLSYAKDPEYATKLFNSIEQRKRSRLNSRRALVLKYHKAGLTAHGKPYVTPEKERANALKFGIPVPARARATSKWRKFRHTHRLMKRRRKV